jgi:hypothetical protein
LLRNTLFNYEAKYEAMYEAMYEANRISFFVYTYISIFYSVFNYEAKYEAMYEAMYEVACLKFTFAHHYSSIFNQYIFLLGSYKHEVYIPRFTPFFLSLLHFTLSPHPNPHFCHLLLTEPLKMRFAFP